MWANPGRRELLKYWPTGLNHGKGRWDSWIRAKIAIVYAGYIGNLEIRKWLCWLDQRRAIIENALIGGILFCIGLVFRLMKMNSNGS